MATRGRCVRLATPFGALFAAAWPASRVVTRLVTAVGGRVKRTLACRPSIMRAVWHVLLGHWSPRGARLLSGARREALLHAHDASASAPREAALAKALGFGKTVPVGVCAYAVLATMLHILDLMPEDAIPPELYTRATWSELRAAVCAADPLDPFPGAVAKAAGSRTGAGTASAAAGFQHTPIGVALAALPRTFNPMHWLSVVKSKELRRHVAASTPDAETAVRMGRVVATALQNAHPIVTALVGQRPGLVAHDYTVALLVGMCTAAARVRTGEPPAPPVAGAYAQVVRSGTGQRCNPVAVLRALEATHPSAVVALLETARLAAEVARIGVHPLPAHVTRRQVAGLVTRYGALLNRRVCESLMCSRCKQPHSITLPAPGAISRQPVAPAPPETKQPRPRARRRRAAREQEECYHSLVYDVFTGTVSCAEYKSAPTTTMPSASAATRPPPSIYPLPLLGYVVVLNNSAALSLCMSCGAHTYLDIPGRGYNKPVCRKCVATYGDDYLDGLCVPSVSQ